MLKALKKNIVISTLGSILFHGVILYFLWPSFHGDSIIDKPEMGTRKPLQIVSVSFKRKEQIPKKSRYYAEIAQIVKKETKLSSSSGLNEKDPKGLFKMMSDSIKNTSGPSLIDTLDDVEVGARTELNTLRFKHATFFNRVKESIARIWAPEKQMEIYDPKGLLVGRENRRTTLQISIDKNGHLASLRMKKSSGVSYLDEEALRAVRLSSPFLYPPKELFSTKEYFSFAFSFYLIVNKGFAFDFN